MDFKSLLTKISSMDDPIDLPSAPATPTPVQLNEDAQLRVLAGTSSLSEEINKQETLSEAAKPDFLDVDKDGDKKEPFKKAVKDKKEKEVEEGIEDRLEAAREKAAAKGKTKDEEKTKDSVSSARTVKGSKYGGSKQKEDEVEESVAREKFLAKVEEVSEAKKSYSAKAARAGKDIGKPGKNFEKIAKKAGKEYGSKEKGEKVAGAVLKKLRAKESVANEAACSSKMKKRKTVKESVEPKLTFKDMVRLVQESGGQQQIDPVDQELFAWATRVANAKFTESTKAEMYAGLVYERMGGVFEMYDVLNEDKK